MLRRPLLIAILASPMFVPVTCTTVMLPLAHGLSHADARDVAAGQPPHVLPLVLPVVDRADPRMAITLDAAELPAALARWPGLTARLPPAGNTAGRERDHLFWRVLGEDDGGQRIELVQESADFTHTLRYRVDGDRVTVLSSRLFSRRHWWPAGAVGAVVALLLMAVVRGRRFLPAATSRTIPPLPPDPAE